MSMGRMIAARLPVDPGTLVLDGDRLGSAAAETG
jgi:hypothetical protein